MKTMKRIITVILSLTIIISMCSVSAFAATDTYKQSLINAGFPESYASRLAQLHELHPNWVFEPVKVTELNSAFTFDYVVGKETENPKTNLVTTSSWAPSPWNTLGQANYTPYYESSNTTLYDSGWRQASKAAVKYFMDPRNFLNEIEIFMFESLEYNSDVHTVDRVQTALANTFMGGSNMCDNDITYSQHIWNCGVKYGVSPVALAARLRSEQGGGGSPLVLGTLGTTLVNYYNNKPDYDGNDPIWGDVKKTDVFDVNELKSYDGYYNFFNIGACGTGRFAIYLNGAREAVAGGWDTKAAAIEGGSQKYADKYVKDRQATVYFQKFNVDPRSSRALWGQYMQNIAAPVTESRTSYNTYKSAGIIDKAFKFLIPVYGGMPSTPCPDPAGGNSYYSPSITTTGTPDTPETPDKPTDDSNVSYKVRCGLFSVRSNADNLSANLKAAGFDNYIDIENGQYAVYSGVYSVKANADARVAAIKAAGFDACIITVGGTTAPTSYTATSSVAGGSGTVKFSNGSTSISATSGSTVSFTATPATGYKVTKVMVNSTALSVLSSGAAATYSFSMPAQATTVSVTFGKISYKATAKVAGGSGTVTFSNGSTSMNGTVGDTMKFTATPASGYRVSKVTVNGTALSVTNSGKTATYSFSMPAKTTAVEVTFAKLYKATATIASGSGTVTFSNGATSMSATSGTTMKFTATPASGYRVSKVTVNGTALSVTNSGKTATYSFSMPAKTTAVEVTFAKLYKATATIGSGSGTATFSNGSTSISAISGTTIKLTATPATGYKVTKVTVNGTAQTILNSGAASTYSFKMPAKTTAVNVTFGKISYKATASVASGSGTVKFSNGSTSMSATSGTTMKFTATPASGYRVSKVTVDGKALSILNSGKTATYSYKMPASKSAVSVTFAKLYTATATASGGSGSVLFSNNATSITAIGGSKIMFTAIPGTGYKVSKITVNGTAQTILDGGTTATYTISMPAKTTSVVVTFAKEYKATASVASGSGKVKFSNGSTSMNAIGGTTMKFTVTPATGYKVTKVTVNGTAQTILNSGATATYSFKMPAKNTTVSVTFGKISYKATATVAGGSGTVKFSNGSTSMNATMDTTMKFTVTPASGYKVSKVTINGTAQTILKDGATATYSFKMPAKTTTVSVTFEKVASTTTMYRVRCGVFSVKSNADNYSASLKAAGFDNFIECENGEYKVYAGSYSVKANAEAQVAKIKAAGFDAIIVTVTV
ncbi:MAG: SPOR domain-containing protein [Acutalibacteraceae bacterium]